MQAQQTQDSPIATVTLLGVSLTGAHLLGLGLAVGASRLAGWTAPEGGFGPTESAFLGLVAVLLGSICGLVILVPGPARSARRLGVSVLIASSVRLVVALGAAVGLFLVTQNEPHAFFVSVLACGILSLAAETAWAVSSLRRVTPTRAPTASMSPSQPDSRGAHAA